MWNYRVVRRKEKEHIVKHFDGAPFLFDIQEVYYNDKDEIIGFCDAGITDWESVEDLKGTVERMLEAFTRPVITEDVVAKLVD